MLNKHIYKNEDNGGLARHRPLTMIFFSTIKTLKYVAKLLQGENWMLAEFHSQLPQNIRERALYDFKAGKKPLLLATDMAARGIHIKNLEVVINYDFPTSLEQYVHRCGRAGRSTPNVESYSANKVIQPTATV